MCFSQDQGSSHIPDLEEKSLDLVHNHYGIFMWAAAEIYYTCQSRFSCVYLVFEVFQDIRHSKKENPNWNAHLSCPLVASSYANSHPVPISFWFVLDADHALGFFLSCPVLQACISFCSVSDKSGASLFLPCSHKNAVAHVFLGYSLGRSKGA